MDPFIGQIVLVGFNFAPRGWAFCDGQLIPISSNSALFSLLGTTYGGDGRTTFALPDLRSRSAVHPGHGPGLDVISLGQRGGVPDVTLSVAQLPAHHHAVDPPVYAGAANQTSPVGTIPATMNPTSAATYSNAATNGSSLQFNTANTGNTQPVHTRNPYLGLNYIIALYGVYPSRS